MKEKQKRYQSFLSLLLAFCLMFACGAIVRAAETSGDESEEETEYIPEEYYAPIESNELKGWPQGQAIQAASAVVMDLDTNALLYSKNAYAKMYPASITKIMTAMLVLENGNLDDEITFSDVVYDIESDSSHAGIQPGEKMTVRQALNALMLESANDAANGLAEYVSGSVSAFAELMTQRAKELGCVNTHFTNPHGLHNEEHYTCAYDMALIAQAAYATPYFQELASNTIFDCPETNMTDEVRYWVNHHKMLHVESEYYEDWCTGGKTGFTSDAWNTLVTFGEKDGMRLVGVILHDNGAGKAYEETAAIMNYGFDEFNKVEMLPDRTFPSVYEAMKLNYLGIVSDVFQMPELKKPTAELTKPGTVTVPKGFSLSDLTTKVEAGSDKSAEISYQYGDWPVGSGWMTLAPLNLDIKLPFEQKLDMDVLLKKSSSQRSKSEVQETALMVVQNTKDFVQEAYALSRKYVEENTLMVICVGSFVLLLLIVVIIILVIRCTKESRIQKRRMQEERERQRIEDEIERKTTAEIEQELRAAMEQERRAREMESARQEAKRQEEEKLRETERMLEEINRNE